MSKLALVDAIKTHGPMTSREFAEVTGYSYSYARASVCYCKRAKQVFVLRYEREVVGGHLYPRAVYDVGDRRDAPKLRPLTKTEHNRRHRENKRGRVASVFDLASPVDARRLSTKKRTDVSEKRRQGAA